MYISAEASGIPFKKIFRPPAWKLHKDAPAVLKDMEMEIIAGHMMYPYESQECVKDVWATSCPPVQQLEYNENNVVVYHACVWDKNVLDYSAMKRLDEFISVAKDDIEFCFMWDM